MDFDRPFKGPEVRWNFDDVQEMVDHYGLEMACQRIAEGVFELSYVERIVQNILNSESDMKTQSFSNEGTV